MAWCLNSKYVAEFRRRIQVGEITPEQLNALGSAGRRAYFEEFLGPENAKQLNLNFETKKLLRNQQQAMISWAQQAMKDKPKALRDAVSKVNKLSEVLTPENEVSFLSDLAEHKLGTAVTMSEASELARLGKAVSDTKIAWETKLQENAALGRDYLKKKPKERAEYGAQLVAFDKYYEHLKGLDKPIKEMLLERGQEFKATWKEHKLTAAYELGRDALKQIADNSVSLVATLDNSFIGSQGFFTLITHPTRWYQGAKQSFVSFANRIGGKNAHDAVLADLYSDPRYMSGEYKKANIIAKTEEQYPSSFPERIPGAGRVFAGSADAFRDSGLVMRKGIYDLLADRIVKNGVDMMQGEQAASLGKMVNSLTARGLWGKTGEPAVVRLILWAPKMLKGQLDVLTAHNLGVGLKTSFARKEAIKNIAKIVGTVATTMAVANAIKPGSAEINPLSSAFGAIKAGNNYFDITAGMRQIVILAARLLTGKSKSLKGKVQELGPGFGRRSRLDVGFDFLTNKVTPPAGVVRDWAKGEFFDRTKFNLPGAAYRSQVPMPVQSGVDLISDADADDIVATALGLFGVRSFKGIKKK